MTEQAYWLHHLCIYDEKPREHMWTWLKWYHAIPQYYWVGEEFHLTDEGHVDYTFLGCGSGFQIQMESPPFQFKYEQEWHKEHGSGVNHICWIVPNAKATVDRAGIGCEPASAASVAGLLKYRNRVPSGATIVCVLTGNGLKDPITAVDHSNTDMHTGVPADLNSVAKVMGF